MVSLLRPAGKVQTGGGVISDDGGGGGGGGGEVGNPGGGNRYSGDKIGDDDVGGIGGYGVRGGGCVRCEAGVRNDSGHSVDGSHALWSGTNKNRDVSTGPLARPFAHSFAPLTRSLAHFAHSLARGKVNF